MRVTHPRALLRGAILSWFAGLGLLGMWQGLFWVPPGTEDELAGAGAVLLAWPMFLSRVVDPRGVSDRLGARPRRSEGRHGWRLGE